MLKRNVLSRRFFENPQHMFWLRNKNNYFQVRALIWRPVKSFKSFFILFQQYGGRHFQTACWHCWSYCPLLDSLHLYGVFKQAYYEWNVWWRTYHIFSLVPMCDSSCFYCQSKFCLEESGSRSYLTIYRTKPTAVQTYDDVILVICSVLDL